MISPVERVVLNALNTNSIETRRAFPATKMLMEKF
jgi:hypothetical protein